MRIALGIEYDGSAYRGWQCQEGQKTVQQSVEQALSRVADQPIQVVCAGRTDAGVHACEQIAHFDTTAERDMYGWVFGANTNMDPDVRLLWAQPVDDDFHARYSAIARTYHYVISSRKIRSALLRNRVSWDYRSLDIEAMQAGAGHLIGEHDFSSFRAAGCQSSTPMRCVESIDVSRRDDLVCIRIRANAFLHHMVRNIAGVLMEVGAGEQTPDWVADVLAARDRCAGGVTAAPDGLYFWQAHYPEEIRLPRREGICTPMAEG